MLQLYPANETEFAMVRFPTDGCLQAALQDPDVQLMLRLREGDRAAFDALYDRYASRVRAVITHLMGNNRQTEDLTQDVFLRLYRARKTYVVGAKFSTWLFTIVNNVVLNARRSLARRREVSGNVDTGQGETLLESGDFGMELVTPDMLATRSELQSLVQAGVGQLADRQRRAVALCDFEGLCYADVAEALGTSPDAAKSLIHRGRTALRRILEPQVETGSL
jgi:RNA polymerase sigma-70 factor (ECF subfamily)